MSQIQITLPYGEFTVPIVAGKNARNPLSVRDIKGGVSVDLTQIPPAVLSEIVISAVSEYLRTGLKALDKNVATTEDCQAAMKARLDLLKTGAKAGTTRKKSVQDPVRALAKSNLRKAIQEQTEEKIDPKELTSNVTQIFKAHDAYVKALKKGTEAELSEYEDTYNLVKGFIDQARETIAKQEKMTATLASFMNKLPADEAPAPRPTPTERAKSRPANAKGRSA